jgi:hypothetical protein
MSIPQVPTFVSQPKDTPMAEFALRVLVEFAGGETHVIGTAVVIASYLAVTAGHVLDDITERFGLGESGDNEQVVSDYAIRLYQLKPDREYIVWNVFTAWRCPDSDLALLHLGLHSCTDPTKLIAWRSPPLHFTSPPIGTAIAAFGYHSSITRTTPNASGGYHLDLDDKPTTSTGPVEEILPGGQPSGNFTFPCFRVAARFDGGMSGGPVFDDRGMLRGIISGTMFAGDHIDTPISYVCMLWPLLRLMIDVNRGNGHPRNVRYPLIHLVRDGLIHSDPTSLEGIDPAVTEMWMSTGVKPI